MRKSDLIDRILVSEEGKEILDHISPIYDDSYIGLWMLQAIGAALDKGATWSAEFWDQIRVETATWALGFWEKEYGILTDPAMSIENRRNQLLTKIRFRGSANPARMAAVASRATGVPARCENHTAKNTFAVVLAAIPTQIDEVALRAVLDKAKPAHLIYTIEYERSVGQDFYTLGVMQTAATSTIRQV
ncbi:MAG: putative phage tail protein [Eubacteriaceae bacterium]|nr:putative phage tail protein [Eubacteriaceae bacterium]